jgi:hypothetical protein
MATGFRAPPERSTFVTALAWIIILLSVGFLLLSGIQLLILAAMPPEALDMVAGQPGFEEAPWIYRTLMSNLQLLLFLNFVWIAMWLAGGLGLRKRSEWARALVSWMLFASTALILAGTALQLSTASDMAEWQSKMMRAQIAEMKEGRAENPFLAPGAEGGGEAAALPPEVLAQFEETASRMEGLTSTMTIVTAVVSVLFALLFGFLGWKLRSEKIREEFA